jgi:hypothetical protein
MRHTRGKGKGNEDGGASPARRGALGKGGGTGGNMGLSLACVVCVVIVLWFGAMDRLKGNGLQAKLDAVEVETGRMQVNLGAQRASIGRLRKTLRSLHRADMDATAELARLASRAESIGAKAKAESDKSDEAAKRVVEMQAELQRAKAVRDAVTAKAAAAKAAAAEAATAKAAVDAAAVASAAASQHVEPAEIRVIEHKNKPTPAVELSAAEAAEEETQTSLVKRTKAEVEELAKTIIANNLKPIEPSQPAGSKIVWKKSHRTSEALQGLQLADGRTLYTVTFQTGNTLGPGFCYMTASALLYGLRPHALWWSREYAGMITKVYAFIKFFEDFNFKADDLVLFIDGRDTIFQQPVMEVVNRFDASGEDFFWGADGGCIPGFCDYNRRMKYPKGAWKNFPKFRFLNSGTFIAKAGFTEEYFKELKPLVEDAGTDIDQGIISIAFVDALLKTGKFKHRVAIDSAADYFVSAWFVPLEIIQKAKAAVIHFNGGFNVGAEDDKKEDGSLDGLMMRVSQSFFYPPFRNFEKIHGEKVTLQGVDKVNTWRELCPDLCVPKPTAMDTDMLHAKCDAKKPKDVTTKQVLDNPEAKSNQEKKYRALLPDQ